jgi:acyl-CoA hydrolase
MEGRPVKASQSYLSELALPNDVNGLGTLLGGRIMHLVDIAGAVAAARHARQFVVTAAFDHMSFLEPVYEGELIVLRASVNRAFNTSMEVGVKVYAENMRAQEEQRHVASAYLTFVALDRNRQKHPVPPVIAETDEEKRRYQQAGYRREYRLAHRQAAPPVQG